MYIIWLIKIVQSLWLCCPTYNIYLTIFIFNIWIQICSAIFLYYCDTSGSQSNWSTCLTIFRICTIIFTVSGLSVIKDDLVFVLLISGFPVLCWGWLLLKFKNQYSRCALISDQFWLSTCSLSRTTSTTDCWHMSPSCMQMSYSELWQCKNVLLTGYTLLNNLLWVHLTFGQLRACISLKLSNALNYRKAFYGPPTLMWVKEVMAIHKGSLRGTWGDIVSPWDTISPS